MSGTTNYEPISYEFDNLKAETWAELHSKSEWTNLSEDDVAVQILLHILTAKESALFGMINNTFTDYFPNISSAAELVYAFADYIKMPIIGMTSSNGTVKFSIPSVHSKRILLPIRTEISNERGNIIFSTSEVQTIEVGETEIEVSVIQGQWKTQNHTADGTDYQRYYVYEDNDAAEIVVKVNDVEWTKVDNFYFSTNVDQHYMIKFIQNGLFIIFSDGTFGAKPQNTDVVSIEYLKTIGIDGDIYSVDIINTIVSTIYDADDEEIENISVTNEEQIVGGYAGDSLLDIQRNISRYFITNPYITRRIDYVEYLKSHAEIIDANVYAGWELYPNDKDYWMLIVIYVVPKNTRYLTEAQKVEINDYIKLKDIFLTKILFEDVAYIGINLDYVIKFKDSKISSAAINQIKNEITQLAEDYFDLELAIENYGTVFRDVYHAEILEQVMDITELRKANLNLQSVETIEEIEDNDTSFTKDLEYSDIRLEKTYLYIENEKVGTYNDSWVLVPIDNSGDGGRDWTTVITSSINYSTRSVEITIIDPTITDPDEVDNIIGDVIYLRSDPLLDINDNDDDIYADESGNMVFEYHDSFIDVEI